MITTTSSTTPFRAPRTPIFISLDEDQAKFILDALKTYATGLIDAYDQNESHLEFPEDVADSVLVAGRLTERIEQAVSASKPTFTWQPNTVTISASPLEVKK